MDTLVLTIPAGDSHHDLKAHRVYSCPDSYPDIDMTYLAFRQRGGGEMDTIYAVETMFTLDPHDETTWRLAEPPYHKRIRNYILARRQDKDFRSEPHRFYLLSPVMELSHRPKPVRNNVHRCLYTWTAMTSGTKIVQMADR